MGISTTMGRQTLRTRTTSKTDFLVEESKCVLMGASVLFAVKTGTTVMLLSSADNWTSHPMVNIYIVELSLAMF